MVVLAPVRTTFGDSPRTASADEHREPGDKPRFVIPNSYCYVTRLVTADAVVGASTDSSLFCWPRSLVGHCERHVVVV